LTRVYKGPVEIRHLGEQASGMLVDRATIREAEDLIACGWCDLVMAEDLSRIFRNPRHQYNFVQDAVDAQTRVICIADNLDTADENWEIMLGAATLRHGMAIPDVRRRVRRTATHAFHQGGMVMKIRYGYRKLTAEEAATARFGPLGLRLTKRPECTPIIHEIRDRLLHHRLVAPVVEWLNEAGIDPGPYVQGRRWTRAVLKGLMCDPLLSGTRFFRDVLHRPIYKTGKSRRERNREPETEHYPQLAHLTVDEQESLLQAMDWTFNKGQAVVSMRNRRRGVPRRRSIWPGQAATCAVCGGPMYLMGDHLRCRNSLKEHRTCWNRVQVSVEITRQRLLDWLLAQFTARSECWQAFVQAAWGEFQRRSATRRQAQTGVGRQIRSLQSQAQQLAKAIRLGGQLSTLVTQLADVERELERLRGKAAAEAGRECGPARFDSPQQIEPHLQNALRQVAGTSYEFADVMRRRIVEFTVCPVIALDTTQVRPRGKLRFAGEDAEREPLLVLDLFEAPLHVQAIPAYQSAKATSPRISLRKMATVTGFNYMTLKRASVYLRKMEDEGVTDPYCELNEPPRNAARWR
jgi:hypothetical protein